MNNLDNLLKVLDLIERFDDEQLVQVQMKIDILRVFRGGEPWGPISQIRPEPVHITPEELESLLKPL